MNPRLIEQLRRDEGEVLTAYTDTLGYITIGIGRLIDRRKGGGISKDEAAYLLNNDIARVDAGLRSRLSWYGQLDEVRQAGLMNMAFQLGVDGLLGFTRSLACIRDGRFAEAETHLLASKWAEQTPARSRRVARQIASGEWQ